MRLSRLELLGFKSFLHKTVFNFGEGITAIVGPNGCGKSNVIDAVIWVLGERGTKSLRIKDMEDVIFHGTNGRRPLGFAEVTIEFIDKEGEVSIRRRIFRDGTNEYFINNHPVRLKDIVNFFLGTGLGMNGFAIVEQGKLDTIVQMRPLERRILIEEACGTTRFEEKKTEALARIEEVRLNLERLEDVYKEVRANWESTKKEWERWKRYGELTERLRNVEMMILKEGLRKIDRRKGKVEEDLFFLKREMDLKVAEKKNIEGLSGLKKGDLSLIEESLRKMEVDMKEKERQEERTLMEVNYLMDEKARSGRHIEDLKRAIFDLEKERTNTESKIEELKRKAENMEREMEESGAKIREREERLYYIKKELEEVERALEEKRKRLFVVASELAELKNRLIEIERRLMEKDAREKKRNDEISKIEKDMERLEEKRALLIERESTLKEALKETCDELGSLEKEREEIMKKIGEIEVNLRRLQGEREIKENYLKILRPESEKKEEGKRLIDKILIEGEREWTLETFFSRELSYTVSQETEPSELAKFIRDKGGGVVFFINERGILEEKGEKVNIKIKEEKSLEDLLKRIIAGEEGLFISEGYAIDSRGFVHKRSREEGSIKKHKEIWKTEREIEDLKSSIEEAVRVLGDWKKRLSGIEKTIQDVKKRKEKMEETKVKMEKEMENLRIEIVSLQRRHVEIIQENPMEYSIEPSEKEELQGRKNEKEKEKILIEREYEELKKKMEELRRDFEKESEAWHKDSVELERKKERFLKMKEDLRRSQSTLEKLKEEKRNKGRVLKEEEERIEELKRKEKEKEEMLKKIMTEKENIRSLLLELAQKGESLKAEIKIYEERLRTHERNLESIRRKKEEMEKERILLEEKRNVILEKMGNYGEFYEEERSGLPLANLEKEREEIVRERDALGEINFRAEKEFREINERLTFIEKEKNDLETSLDSLKKTIARIENYSREVFLSTFQAINETFKNFTERLFGGGIGYLKLNDDTQGVEMFVQPKGKRVQRMESLSGGEKALASLCFLLSLIDTKPTPFSMLDEVDATLDDANILRLREILREIKEKTQLVIVSHNRLTVEISDVIYGITMEEEGISKVVSARI